MNFENSAKFKFLSQISWNFERNFGYITGRGSEEEASEREVALKCRRPLPMEAANEIIAVNMTSGHYRESSLKERSKDNSQFHLARLTSQLRGGETGSHNEWIGLPAPNRASHRLELGVRFNSSATGDRHAPDNSKFVK